ncbi:MAG: hypothetical protein A2W23_06210 [Planctomycetes bacterium RBG_16_43_13]|nr:MAG: hypothetical protein A2W23_06210 [Planctomycetes bacterium RBG_16_43_13]
MENYTKINKMENMRRAIENIHKQVSDMLCPICKQPQPCPMETEKLSGMVLPKKEKMKCDCERSGSKSIQTTQKKGGKR